jgi:hypothetical protein
MRIRLFKKTPPFLRPFADFGTLAFYYILQIKIFPFTYFKKQLLVACFYVEFESEEDFVAKLRAGKIPAGAVWDIGKFGNYRKGFDGRSLVVMTPYGQWFMDGRSLTCTRKDDENHRCWVREGSPENQTLTVGKKGDTCESGAGSVGIKISKHDTAYSYHARLMKNTLIRIPFF